MSDQPPFFIAGGPLAANTPSYVVRPADQELLDNVVRDGAFCYVLTARQMGKSSLMVRAASQLRDQDFTIALVDLARIDALSTDGWYLALLMKLKQQLNLTTDVQAWWRGQPNLSAPQRFFDFFHDLVLSEVPGNIALFVDEIDSMLRLNFRDDFFAAIRAVYNARASDPVFERLTFVVLGVATPLDLRDSKKLNHPTWCIMRSRLTCAGGSTMELTDSLKALFIETATTLTGSARRLFMARTVKELGPGGQRRAERELGWNRETIRKGSRELESGLICLDNFAARGRKPSEAHLPNLLSDIASIVDAQSQADPQFRTNRLYTRLDAAEVRRQLIGQNGYTDAELPTVQTITTKLNALGYYPQKVAKSAPKKRFLKPTRSSTR